MEARIYIYCRPYQTYNHFQHWSPPGSNMNRIFLLLGLAIVSFAQNDYLEVRSFYPFLETLFKIIINDIIIILNSLQQWLLYIALGVFPQRVVSVTMHFIKNYKYLIREIKISVFGILSFKNVRIALSDFVLERWDILF